MIIAITVIAVILLVTSVNIYFIGIGITFRLKEIERELKRIRNQGNAN